MPKAKKRDTGQFQRFKEAVKEFGADESTETLERALEKVAPPKKPKADPPKSD